MKKILLFAAATAVALSSCSKDEVTSTSADIQKEISFSTYVGNTTKAGAGVIENDDFLSFGIYAEYDADGAETVSSPVDYFTTGVTRTSSSVSWYTTNTYYWPTSGTLSFYAYNNDLTEGVAIATLDASTKKIVFDSDGTEDLVVAVSENNTASSNAAAVELTFAHVLTKVTLGFLPDVATPSTSNHGNDVDVSADYKFEITSISLSAIADATYTYASSSTTGTWGTNGTAEPMSFDEPTEFLGNATSVATTEEYMLIPETAATFTVKYKVYHKADYTTTDTWVEIADHSSTGKSVTITALGEQGKNTKYVLSLPIDGNAISFTTTFEGWDTTNSDVNKDVE